MLCVRCLSLCVSLVLVKSELASVEDVMDTDSLETAALRLSLLQAPHALTHRASKDQPTDPGNNKPDVFPATPRSYEDLVPDDFYPASLLLEEPLGYANKRDVHHGAEICAMPVVHWLNDTFPKAISSQIEILDVGGGEGMIEEMVQNMTELQFKYTCVDVVASDFCEEYPGDRLTLPSDSRDVVMFLEMFHHVPYSTIDLLEDAARIARSYVVVSDFIHPESFPEAKSIFDHEWKAPTRSEHEWEKIFDLVGYQIVFKQKSEKYCTYPLIFEYFREVTWVLVPRGKSSNLIGAS